MNNSRMKLCAVLLAAATIATGCGDKAIQMTSTEESLIVNYAAHVVSKYNTRQPDGLVYVPVSTEEIEENTKIEKPDANESTEEPGTEMANSTETLAGTADGSTEEVVPQVTLSEALGLAGVDVAVSSTELRPTYVEQDYYALDATAGKTYLVVNFTLTNTTAEDYNCDLLTQTPTFKATVNGTNTVPAETTILLNDLSTYQGTIPAGGTADAVLLFQVPADEVTQIDTLSLKVKINGNSSEIPCM